MRERGSATSPEFRETVRGWLTTTPELLVLRSLSRAAGRKDWYLIRDLADLDDIVERSRPSDCLTVFSQPQLPFRLAPRAHETVVKALTLVGETEECVFGQIVKGDPELADSFEAVPSDQEWVSEWLGDRPEGAVIAFGPYPPFLDPDPRLAIDGIVPDADGSVTSGVY